MQDADNIPDLKPCPFCGRRAVYMGYDLRDPISGKPRSRVMIGCPAAFTARGDWGDDRKACPVAPMIDSLVMPAGGDIIDIWNTRADTISAGKVFTLHEKTAGGEWWQEFQTEEQRHRYIVERRIWAHYEHAREKHPRFCDILGAGIGTPNVPEKTAVSRILAERREKLAIETERGVLTWPSLLMCEMFEVLAEIADGKTDAAVEECYDAIAVLLRVIDVLEGRQKLGRPEEQGAAQ